MANVKGRIRAVARVRDTGVPVFSATDGGFLSVSKDIFSVYTLRFPAGDGIDPNTSVVLITLSWTPPDVVPQAQGVAYRIISSTEIQVKPYVIQDDGSTFGAPSDFAILVYELPPS